MELSEFFDRYWWAVFLFLFFMASFVLKPATSRAKKRAGGPSPQDGAGPAVGADADCPDSDGGD